MRRLLALMAATWFGSGLIPPIVRKGMAGTYGSAAALPLCYFALSLPPVGYGLLTFVLFLVGVWSVPHAEKALGPRMDWHGVVKTHDQNQIVVDEVVGMLITCMPLLWLRNYPNLSLLAAFLLFRFFDLVKPWPAGYFDRKENASGVMIDDVFAGAYAAATLAGLHLVLVFFQM